VSQRSDLRRFGERSRIRRVRIPLLCERCLLKAQRASEPLRGEVRADPQRQRLSAPMQDERRLPMGAGRREGFSVGRP
jgi:hypothetical protein